MTKNIFLSILTVLVINTSVLSRTISVFSPNKKVEIKVNVADKISYEVYYSEEKIINESNISLILEKDSLGINPKLHGRSIIQFNDIIYPVVKQKSNKIEDIYNQLILNFNGFDIEFRAYNDAAAFRFITHKKGKIKVKQETAEFNFSKNCKTWFPEEISMMTHQERNYIKTNIYDISKGRFCSLPALFDAGKVKVIITESGLYDYAGMYLESMGKGKFKGKFPPYALKVKQVDLSKRSGDRNIPVTKKADFLAITSGERDFPWRVIAFAQNDGELITNQIVYKLAKKQKEMDFSWVKPGKVAWDWYNDLNIYNVNFKSGINTETYKYYIDFASKYGIEYIILDEGWYVLGDLMNIVPEINMEEIVKYGKEKNVGIILWVVWKTLDDQMEEAFNQFEKWGIKGIKVDFMQRDDQYMVDYYWKVAKEAAKRKMLVDFHGCYKPTGLRRSYPNVITREGVKGLENNKWGKEVTPEHDLEIPFIRMFAGPMDYTPGAMRNANRKNFRAIWSRPMSQGTRCHQLAIYVAYESPLQMLSDVPSRYYKEKDMMKFLSKVPTVWDETKVLYAKVGEYLIIARRNGSTWYIGGLTNWKTRDFTIDLSFLKDGNHKITIWEDGINADRFAEDYKMISKEVSSTEKLNIHLASGGGWTAIIDD